MFDVVNVNQFLRLKFESEAVTRHSQAKDRLTLKIKMTVIFQEGVVDLNGRKEAVRIIVIVHTHDLLNGIGAILFMIFNFIRVIGLWHILSDQVVL